MSHTSPNLAHVRSGLLAALALGTPAAAADTADASVVAPCRIVIGAPMQTRATPPRTGATMTFTCRRPHPQAVSMVQSQQLIRGRWIHQATRTITFFQLKGGHRYRVSTPPIDCSPGTYRTLASVKIGARTTRAQSEPVDIICS
jgi:hypothetical protein